MTLTEVIAELDALGVTLRVVEGRLEYHPRRLVDSSLLAELRHHKAELLRRLDGREVSEGSANDGGPIVETLRWGQDDGQLLDGFSLEDEGGLTPDGWPVNAIDIDELTPCRLCGSYEQWQSAAGDLFGRTPGIWRCVKCEPPTRAIQWRKRVEYLRHKYNKPSPNY